MEEMATAIHYEHCGLKLTWAGKYLLEAITDPRVAAKIKNQALTILIPSLGDNLL